jgi:large subunit ribosomal protein L18
MASTKLELFQKRRMRVRNKLKAVNQGKLRLSVHRSNKNISVQLIDDAEGRTVASASTLEPALGLVGKNNVEAAARIGATIAERAKAGRRDGGLLRPGRLPVPRQGEGPGRRRP